MPTAKFALYIHCARRHVSHISVKRTDAECSAQGPVAQLVRAPPCHGGGREFESLLGRFSHQMVGENNFISAAVAELADARDLKSRG